MTSLKDIIYYFSVFRKYLGYRLYIVFLLTALVVATEAFGIALLLPLLEMMAEGEAAEEPSRINLVLQQILGWMGIQDSMIGIMIFIAVVFLLKGAILFGEGAYKAMLSAGLLREIKGSLFGYYSNMSYRHYAEHNTGHFVNLISQQVNRLLQSFETYKKFLSEIIITVLYMVFAFMIAWRFALMAVVAGGVTLYLFNRLSHYVKDLSRKTSREYSSLHGLLVQTLQAFPYISATGRFGAMGAKVMASIYRLTGYYRKQHIAQALTQAVREPLSVLLILLIVILQIAVFDARLAPILVSLLLIYRAMGHIVAMQLSWQQTMNMIGGLEMVEEEFESVARGQEAEGGELEPALTDRIRLEEVSFTYRGRELSALDRVTMEIKAQTTTAVFGPSGAGKSTLICMLTLLLQPQSGRITIDGHPHEQLNRGAWRRRIGYVPQDPVIFDDTIANNICLWQGDTENDLALKQKIETALDRANLLEFIRELPNGLQTRVGDSGMLLSGGQKQRLTIARELFKQPDLLILDEATSALDSDAEREIHQSIHHLKGSLTIVIISHRMSAIRAADRIYVLDEGRVVSEGTYDELMESDTSFRRIAELQYG